MLLAAEKTKQAKQNLYLPLITTKENQITLVSYPSHQCWRQENTVRQWRGAFTNNGRFFQHGSNSSRHLTRGMSSHRETESSASAKSSGGLQGAAAWFYPIPGSGVVRPGGRDPPRPIRDQHWLHKVQYLPSMSPHVSTALALQVGGDVLAHRDGDGAQRRKWLMRVSYPRHQRQFGSSAKTWIKLVQKGRGGFQTFYVSRRQK